MFTRFHALAEALFVAAESLWGGTRGAGMDFLTAAPAVNSEGGPLRSWPQSGAAPINVGAPVLMPKPEQAPSSYG